MGRKTKAARHTKTLKKNVFLLFISVAILGGALWLFLNIIELPGMPFRIERLKPGEVVSAIKTILKKDEFEDRHIAEVPPKNGKKAEASIKVEEDYKYSFYDVLYHQKHAGHENSRFSVQIQTFKTMKSAQDYAKELGEEKRLNCRVVKNNSHYSVLWGGFPSKNVAERYNRQLSKMLEKECIVVGM